MQNEWIYDREIEWTEPNRDYEYQNQMQLGFMFRPQYYIVLVLINMAEMPTTAPAKTITTTTTTIVHNKEIVKFRNEFHSKHISGC